MVSSSILDIATLTAPLPSFSGGGQDSHVTTLALPSGGFIASWVVDFNGDGTNDAIAAQRVKADGTLDGGLVTLGNLPSAGISYWQGVAPMYSLGILANGNFVVSYVAPPSSGVHVQTYDATGHLLSNLDIATVTAPLPSFSGASSGGSQDSHVTALALPSGGFVASWVVDFNGDGTNDAIAAQRVKADGTLDGGLVTLGNLPSAGISYWQGVAPMYSLGILANGNFVVSYVAPPSSGVHVQTYDATGHLLSLFSTDAADTLFGGVGNDTIHGGLGNDTLDGSAGVDLAIYDGARSSAAVIRDPATRVLTVGTSLDGADAIHHIEQLKFADGLYSFTFANPGAALVANFNPSNGWASQDQAPRHVADVNGDGYADVVGFGTAGVLVAFGAANGSFGPVSLAVSNFGQAAGWTSDNAFHRVLVDVNGDGRADIIGFGQAGTLVSLAQANGTFAAPVPGIANFGAAQGWTSDTAFHRVVGDVNGDGKADIVGFGQAGTLVALGNGDGTFKPVQSGLANFGAAQGWTSDNTFHRELADVNGDGKADIIGFGQAGTLVALSNGDGTFQPVQSGLANFGTAQGWASNDSFARLVADVNGDHIGDIVGFGQAGTLVAFGNGDGTFTEAGFDLANFGAAQGWTSDATFHREVADLNHDGLADIVGFGFAGVLAGMNQGDFLI